MTDGDQSLRAAEINGVGLDEVGIELVPAYQVAEVIAEFGPAVGDSVLENSLIFHPRSQSRSSFLWEYNVCCPNFLTSLLEALSTASWPRATSAIPPSTASFMNLESERCSGGSFVAVAPLAVEFMGSLHCCASKPSLVANTAGNTAANKILDIRDIVNSLLYFN
jgi:hypothetical protein